MSPSVRPSICPQSCRSLSPAPQAVPPPSPRPFPLGQGRPKPWQEGAGPGAVAAAGTAVPRQVQHLPPRKKYDCSAPAAEPVRLPSRHTRTRGRFKCPVSVSRRVGRCSPAERTPAPGSLAEHRLCASAVGLKARLAGTAQPRWPGADREPPWPRRSSCFLGCRVAFLSNSFEKDHLYSFGTFFPELVFVGLFLSTLAFTRMNNREFQNINI